MFVKRVTVAAVAGLALLLGLTHLETSGQEKKTPGKKPAKEVWTDGKDPTLPADFKYQGEYQFSLGDIKVGCQVIALGNGQFQAVLERGGLPGAGWDGKDKALMAGKLIDGNVIFKPAEGKRKYLAQNPDEFSATAKFPPEGNVPCEGEIVDGVIKVTIENKVSVTEKSRTQEPDDRPEAAPARVVLFDGTSTDEWNGGRVDKSTGFLNTDGKDIITKRSSTTTPPTSNSCSLPSRRPRPGTRQQRLLSGRTTTKLRFSIRSAWRQGQRMRRLLHQGRRPRSTCVCRRWNGKPTMSTSPTPYAPKTARSFSRKPASPSSSTAWSSTTTSRSAARPAAIATSRKGRPVRFCSKGTATRCSSATSGWWRRSKSLFRVMFQRKPQAVVSPGSLMKTEILSIGTELTTGHNLDTNSQWLSLRLAEIGIAVGWHTTIADDLADNLEAVHIAVKRAEFVVVTGGLGPTLDDLTREVLAQAAGVELVLHEPSLAYIQGLFERRQRAMPERNRVQAYLPQGAEPLDNPLGTAPGIWMQIGKTARRDARRAQRDVRHV